MIIGSSYAGVPYAGMRRVIDTPTYAAPHPEPVAGGSPNSGPADDVSSAFARPSVAFYPTSESPHESSASGRTAAGEASSAVGDAGSEGLLIRQTARIVAAMAAMSGMDDMSAYAQLGRNEGQTDALRHVVNSYREASE